MRRCEHTEICAVYQGRVDTGASSVQNIWERFCHRRFEECARRMADVVMDVRSDENLILPRPPRAG